VDVWLTIQRGALVNTVMNLGFRKGGGGGISRLDEQLSPLLHQVSSYYGPVGGTHFMYHSLKVNGGMVV
jgi:hypothetical protein